MSSPSVYRGSKQKLVLAFEVGTTNSGISYSVLQPGKVPEIKPVTRFPAHEHISGASKIPTIIYYDRSGKVKAVGAEAQREGIFEMAEDEQWIKSEWFILHLLSKQGAGRHVGKDIPPLPLNKSVVDVFSDFLRYLFSCAEEYIKDTHGSTFWESLKDDIDFVLSHPNGEDIQQQEMRRAAVAARLIPDSTVGHARLSFVTEGEAILHFSIQNGLPVGAMKHGDGVVIVDAGNGTINISSYCRNMTIGKEVFEEVAAPQCHFLGSVFVSLHARTFLGNFLSGSPFHDDLEHIVRCFDKTTKLRFRDSKDFQYIKFGSTRDTDEKYNIRFGLLKLQGSDVAMFFEPSLTCIVKAVMDQCGNAHRPISHVVLVGDFGAHDWLYSNVQTQLAPKGLNIVRPGDHVNKAISDGAISCYLDHFVRICVSKITVGNFCHIPSGPDDHQQRGPSTQVDLTQVESQVAGAQTSEAHINGRSATIMRHSSSTSRPSRYIGGFASRVTSLLGGRSAPVEIPKTKEAKEGRQYRKDFESLSNDYNRLLVENQRFKERVGSLEHESKSVTKRYEEMKSLSDTRGKELVGIQYENQRLKERVGSIEHELKSVTKRYEDVKSLSEERFGTQVFLSKADSLSISDVTQKIHTLNEEIYRAAASLFIVRSEFAEDSKQYMDHSKTLLGPSLARILHTAAGKSDEPLNPFLVQVTLQAFLINFCKKKIDQWTEVESSTDQFLHTLYHEIRSSSEQAVSGRWRSLTRGQLKLETNTWLNELMAELRGILMAASWEVLTEDSVRSFEGKVEAIFKAVLDIRTAIGEKVTSSDIEVNVVPPGSPFSKALMEDDYPGDRREGRPESVVATTGIGLWKVAPSALNGALAYMNVLSPKIVLESTLKAAVFGPPPSAAKSTKTSKPNEKYKT